MITFSTSKKNKFSFYFFNKKCKYFEFIKSNL